MSMLLGPKAGELKVPLRSLLHKLVIPKALHQQHAPLMLNLKVRCVFVDSAIRTHCPYHKWIGPVAFYLSLELKHIHEITLQNTPIS
jgi:hypothetical protein